MSGEEDPLIILFKNFFRTKCLLMNLYDAATGAALEFREDHHVGELGLRLPITFCSGAFDGIRFLLFR